MPVLGLNQDLKFHAIEQFTEVGGVYAEVGRQVLLRYQVEEVRAPFEEKAETGFDVKCHELVMSFDHSDKKGLSGFPKEGFDCSVLFQDCNVVLVGDPFEFTGGDGLQEIL